MDHPLGNLKTSGPAGAVRTPVEQEAEMSGAEEESPFSRWTLPPPVSVDRIHTLWAGAYQAYSGTIRGPLVFQHPEMLWKGIPFAGTLLFILVTHEFGHFILSRIHRVPASLPLFIPGPPHFIGTFGAIIRMRGPI